MTDNNLVRDFDGTTMENSNAIRIFGIRDPIRAKETVPAKPMRLPSRIPRLVGDWAKNRYDGADLNKILVAVMKKSEEEKKNHRRYFLSSQKRFRCLLAENRRVRSNYLSMKAEAKKTISRPKAVNEYMREEFLIDDKKRKEAIELLIFCWEEERICQEMTSENASG